MSLSYRQASLDVGWETDVADLHRLDADDAKNEFAVDGLADAHIDDLPVAGERRDWIVRTAERPDVLVGERRRHGRRRLWRRLRNDDRRRLNHDRLGWWRWGRRRFLVCEEIPFAPVAPARGIEPFHVYAADARSVNHPRWMAGCAGGGR